MHLSITNELGHAETGPNGVHLPVIRFALCTVGVYNGRPLRPVLAWQGPYIETIRVQNQRG